MIFRVFWFLEVNFNGIDLILNTTHRLLDQQF